MRNKKLPTSSRKALTLIGCATVALSSSLFAQTTWTGAGETPDWTAIGNWSAGIPNEFTQVAFDNSYPGGTGIPNNYVNTPFGVNGINYSTISTNGFHHTFLPAGVTLKVANEFQDPLVVFFGSDIGGQTLQYRISGPGSLSVSNSAGAIDVTQTGSDSDHYAILDLTGLTNFTADVQQIRIGATVQNSPRAMGRIILARTNRVHTAAGVDRPGILLGAMENSNTSLRGTQQLLLGQHNEIQSDAISIGGHKSTGAMQFQGGLETPYVSLRGSDGGPVQVLALADQRAGVTTSYRPGTSVSHSGTLNTSGGILDAVVVDMFVGRSGTNSSSTSTGTFTYDQGSLTADNLYLGYHTTGLPSSGQTANASGTVNVNGTAVLNVNNNIMLGRKLGSSNPTGNLNIASNAVVNVKGNIEPSGTGNSAVNNSGLINLNPDGDATKGNLASGTLTGYGRVTNANSVTVYSTLSPGTGVIPSQMDIDGNFVFGNNGGYTFNASSTPAAGNDVLKVTGNLTLVSNLVTLAPLGSSLQNGSYRLMDYQGALSGYLRFVNSTRYDINLDYSTTNQVNLIVSGGAPESLKWNSVSSSVWDTAATNWVRTGNETADQFFTFDSVRFDGTSGLTNLVLLSGALSPGGVTVDAADRNYTFGGSGRLSGGTSLVKRGASMLTISNANDFLGGVAVEAGVLRTINGSALGGTNGGTTISSGATLDIFGSSFYNPGESITVGGTGYTNQGAIVNTGPAQNNAIRFLSLTDDTLITTAARWDLRGPSGSGSFSGRLDLNGHTLTKGGAAQFSIVDSVVTNAGTIELQQGMLGLTRSILGGAGSIRAYTNVVFLENSSTGSIAKTIEFAGGTLRVGGNATYLTAPVVSGLPATVFDIMTASGVTNVMLTLSNAITGPGDLIKSNTGTLMLTVPSTYTGETVVQNGGLKLSADGSIATSPRITLGALTSTGVLDVVDIGSYTLAANQKLGGRGVILGDLTAQNGAGLVPGASAGVLTFSNNLALNGSDNLFELGANPALVGIDSDLVEVAGNLNLAGVNKIKIAPLATLDNTSPYTLFQFSGALVGGTANLEVTSDSRYAFTPSIVGNTIQVTVSGSGASASLFWEGGTAGNPNVWDTKGVANWLKGTTPDIFFLGDNVTFNDDASVGSVSVNGMVQPAAMTVDNSTLNYTFSGPGTIAAGSLTKNGAGSLTIGNAGITVAGETALTQGSINLAGGENLFGSISIDGGSFNVNSPLSTFGGVVSLTGGTLALNPSADMQFGGQLINPLGVTTGLLVKQGTSTVTLSGDNNAYEGAINILQGVLKLGRNTALGASNSGPTTVSGGTLDLNGQALYQFSEAITISGMGLNSTGAVINTAGAQQNALSTIALAGDAAIGGSSRWDLRGPLGSSTFSGVLSLGNFTLTKVGPNQIGLVDTEVSGDGRIDIQGGILALTRCNMNGFGYIQLNTNTILLENYTIGSITAPLVSSGGTLRVIGNPFRYDGAVTNLPGGLIVDPTVNITLAGTVQGVGSLTKVNTGTLILSAIDNSWTGGTFINAGTLQVGSGPANADGSIPNLPIVNNGTLLFNSSANFTNSAEISGTGALTKRGEFGVLTITVSNSFTGNINTGTGTSGEAGGIILLKNSYGFGNTNKVANIVRGELQLDGNIQIPSVIAFATSANADATDWAIGHVAMRNIGGNNVVNGLITLTSGGGSSEFVSEAGSLTLNGNVTANSTGRDLILSGAAPGFLNGAITNNGSSIPRLVKRGANTWTLTAQSTFTGPTTVREGTLLLTATASVANSTGFDVWTNAILNIAAVPSFTVATNSVLRGEGMIQGSVIVDGEVRAGSGASGAEISRLSFANNLTLNGVTALQIDRTNAPIADLLAVAANLTLGGTLVVTNLGEALQMGDTFNLFDAAAISGSFTNYVLPALDPSMGWDVSKLNVDGTITVGAPTSNIPVPLIYQVSANGLEFSWPTDHTGWRLEAQTNSLATGLTNNWATVPGSQETNRVILSIDKASGSVFYRLVYP